MSKFDEMAERMVSEHKRAQAQRQMEADAAKHRQENRLNAAIKFLEDNVLPILEEAQASFQRHGHRVEIKNNWNGDRLFAEAKMTFQLFGQVKRPYDNTSYEVGGSKAIYSHDGDNFRASVTINSGSTAGEKIDEPVVSKCVERGVEMAAQSFFRTARP